MAFQVSNETKVGALAAIAITFLILGYNYMSGQGSIFSKENTLSVILNDVTEISTSTPVLYKGKKIGNVTKIVMNENQKDFTVYFDIHEKIDIPKNSTIKISSALLGGKALNLTKSSETLLATNGSQLVSVSDTTVMESVGYILRPLNAKINSIVQSIDSLLAGGELNRTIASLNTSLKSFTNTSNNASLLLEQNMPKIIGIMNNVESITNNLKNNNKNITLAIANLKKTSDNLAAANLKDAVDKANESLTEVSKIMQKINSGEGSLGLLINDKQLYNNLNQSASDLDKILKDLYQFPAKYIPIPFTKNQRKKAIEASEKANP